jgi:hypothetical protein
MSPNVRRGEVNVLGDDLVKRWVPETWVKNSIGDPVEVADIDAAALVESVDLEVCYPLGTKPPFQVQGLRSAERPMRSLTRRSGMCSARGAQFGGRRS